MDKLVNFFLQNVESTSIIFLRKAKALTAIHLAVFVILSFLIPFLLITKGLVGALVAIIVFTIAFINLFFIYRGKIDFAGNFISFSLILLQVISTFGNFPNAPVFNFFAEEFYIMLAFILLTALFASRLLLIINTLIVLATAIGIHLINLSVYPANFVNQAKGSIIIYIVIVLVVFLLSYFFRSNMEVALAETHKKATTNSEINKRLMLLIPSVKETSSNLNILAQQIEIFSSNLTDKSNLLASSTEEISTAVEEIATTSSKNSNNAKTTLEKSTNTEMVVAKANRAMSHISDIVAEVVEKMTDINEIASKTNLLAVNAAIEAARAGESGKGFSVVAQEVNNLSNLSGRVANEIIDLVKESQKVAATAQIELNETSSKVKETSEFIAILSETAQEQEIGYNEINSGMLEISKTSQLNIEISENLLESVKYLNDSSKKLDNLMNSIKFDI